MTRMLTALAALALIVASQLALSTTADAHERRTVGPYQFVVGWLNEPAFQGFANGASVRITDTRVNPAKAVEGLEKTLAIEVRSGGLPPYTGTVRAVFGQPGLYSLDVVPTAGGAYLFTIKGRVETLDVNETFESGPGRFNDVEPQSALQYPAKAPVAAELAGRLDAIESGIRTVQVIAIVALLLAVAVPVGTLLMARKRS
jgi:hypothetical protein